MAITYKPANTLKPCVCMNSFLFINGHFQDLIGLQGPNQYEDGISTFGIPIIKMSRSWDRLIFIMGISLLVRHLYIKTTPWTFYIGFELAEHVLPEFPLTRTHRIIRFDMQNHILLTFFLCSFIYIYIYMYMYIYIYPYIRIKSYSANLCQPWCMKILLVNFLRWKTRKKYRQILYEILSMLAGHHSFY